jgi:hypothetical protein
MRSALRLSARGLSPIHLAPHLLHMVYKKVTVTQVPMALVLALSLEPFALIICDDF